MVLAYTDDEVFLSACNEGGCMVPTRLFVGTVESFKSRRSRGRGCQLEVPTRWSLVRTRSCSFNYMGKSPSWFAASIAGMLALPLISDLLIVIRRAVDIKVGRLSQMMERSSHTEDAML